MCVLIVPTKKNEGRQNCGQSITYYSCENQRKLIMTLQHVIRLCSRHIQSKPRETIAININSA